MKKLLLLAFTLLSIMLKAQAQHTAFESWRTTSGTEDMYWINVVKTDAFGAVITAGASMSNGAPNIQVTKTDAAGHQIWTKQFGGTGPNEIDFAAGLYVTDHYIYVTGSITTNTATGTMDCIVMKLASATGSVVWSTNYPSAGGQAMGKFIILNGTDLYVTGSTYNTSFNTDMLMLKIDEATGSQTWANTYDYGMNDAGIRLTLSGGNVNIAGAVTSATNNYKVAALTLSPSTGSITAVSISTAVTTSSVDAVADMVVDNANNIIIAGSQDVGGQSNYYVQKMAGGTLITAFTYTFDANGLDDYTKAIAVDASNNIFLTGFSTSSITATGRDVTTIKLNSSGVQQWISYSGLDGNDEASDLTIDASGDAYYTGYRTNATYHDKNYYTAKHNGSTGAKLWDIETDGGNILLEDYATNITIDTLQNVVITGQSSTTTPGTFNFLTTKYIQKEIITPTDFNGESPNRNYLFYGNRGQLRDTSGLPVPDVKFYTNNTYPSFYFKKHSQSFVFSKIDTTASTVDTLRRIDLTFNNVNTSSETYPKDQVKEHYLNYFLDTANVPVSNVYGNQRLITTDLYNNIDLMSSSNQSGIKYYFIVKAGGDIKDIQMEFTGASSFNLNGTTNALSINSPIGSLTFNRPIVYQLTSGNATVAVTGWTADWLTNGASNKYKFNNGTYTSSLTLVIEVEQSNTVMSASSSVCDWSSLYGGAGYENVVKVITDATSNSFFVGETESSVFPNVTGGYLTTAVGRNGFIVKLDQNGGPVWGTYYGAHGGTIINGIALTSTGDIAICGNTTDASLPLVPAINSSFQGVTDCFVGKFNSLGNTLIQSRYYGSGDYETAMDLAMM